MVFVISSVIDVETLCERFVSLLIKNILTRVLNGLGYYGLRGRIVAKNRQRNR